MATAESITPPLRPEVRALCAPFFRGDLGPAPELITPRPKLPAPPAGAFPAVYAIVAHGECMSPQLKDGEPVIISSVAPYGPGDTIVIHFKPETVKPGDFEAIVKVLVDDAGPSLICDQLNPPLTHRVPWERIGSIHKVLGQGVIAADGRVTTRRSMLEMA